MLISQSAFAGFFAGGGVTQVGTLAVQGPALELAANLWEETGFHHSSKGALMTIIALQEKKELVAHLPKGLLHTSLLVFYHHLNSQLYEMSQLAVPVPVGRCLTLSSQCPSITASVSLPNFSRPDTALVNSPPPKNGRSLNSSSVLYPVFSHWIWT